MMAGPPIIAAVILHGAAIAPTKTGGAAWDVDLSGNPRPASEAVKALMLSVAGLPYIAEARLASVFAQPCMAAVAKPDPYGYAEVESGGAVRRIALPIFKDTLTPQWNDARWDRVIIAPGTRFRISLLDKDLVNDDAIGEAVVDDRKLFEAMRSGESLAIRVDDQTAEQLLAVELEVVPENLQPPPVAIAPRR
jgi:hypothetical protein